MADRAQWVKDITTPGRIPVSAWGSFTFPGLPKFKVPSGLPARNTICVDNYDSTRDMLKGVKGWYPSPYMTGVQAIYSTTTTDQTKLLEHVFPVAWWTAAQADLQYLIANKPKNVHNYASIAWTIHVGWLVYHMLLASNVYPTLWGEALSYVKNPAWVPPAVGWNMAMPSVGGELPLDYPGTKDRWSTAAPIDMMKTCWLWRDPGIFWTTAFTKYTGNDDYAHKTQPGSMTTWDKQLWWSGFLRISSTIGGKFNKDVANLGLAIDEVPWSGKTIYGTYAPQFGLSATVFKDTVVDSWAEKNGLAMLQARARFFHRGGLADLAMIYEDANAKSKERLNRDWMTRAVYMAHINYWDFVRAGVTTWRYRTGFPFVQSAETRTRNEVILLPTARQDLKVIYNEFQKSWRQSFIVGPLLQATKWLVNSFKATVRGDFVGIIRAQVDLQKWGKQYAKQTQNAPADPYFFFCTMPPLFLRSPGDAFNAFKDQVVLDTNKEVTETGTEALYTLTERSVRALEKTLGLPLWDPPVKAAAVVAAPVVKKVYSVQLDPEKSGLELPTSNKIWWGLGGLAAIAGVLFWRRK